ncbi:class I SAM-dependent methyltransferase [Massilia sp. R2A-15]|uniref:class I SAM-dependent methyltransferase n=1 Tax=Massilia sp. R2A-15 TaxID=3064278 RepID=UPI002732E65F|nr:class I SAM-dependent methyltransferase [Massilia sp. R2A-15]WLI91332.1 class I SAM-dependent methyltransferase [Massilia sp. R2A-15]
MDRHGALLELGRALARTGYRHVTVTPATHQRVLRRDPVGAASLADIFGWSRRFRACELPQPMMELMQAAGVACADGDGWRSAVRVTSLDGQLYLHSAFPTSAANAVFFGPDTYRFLRALGQEPDRPVARAIDIGCGSGAAAIAIALRWPNAEVLAVDINDEALRLAAVNAELAGAANVRTLHSDLLSGVDGSFDLIVANPPYLLDPSERAYRHGGGELGAGLSLAIVDAALGRLAPGGRLLLYTGVAIVDGADPFLARIAPVLDRAGVDWRYEEIDPDVFGEELDEAGYRRADRIAAVWLRVDSTVRRSKGESGA